MGAVFEIRKAVFSLCDGGHLYLWETAEAQSRNERLCIHKTLNYFID